MSLRSCCGPNRQPSPRSFMCSTRRPSLPLDTLSFLLISPRCTGFFPHPSPISHMHPQSGKENSINHTSLPLGHSLRWKICLLKLITLKGLRLPYKEDRESHCSHQRCAWWCAYRTHAGHEGPCQWSGPNEGCHLTHQRDSLKFQRSEFSLISSWLINHVLRPLELQETAQLEADVFVQHQQVTLAAKVKTVLDS